MAYKSSGQGTGTSASPAATLAGGAPAAGDIIIFAFSADYTTDDGVGPTGFTKLDGGVLGAPDGQMYYVGWKRATGSEGATFTGACASDDWACFVVSFDGRHATDPPTIGTITDNTSSNPTPITVTAPGVTAVDGDDLLMFAFPDHGPDASSFGSWIAGFTERADIGANFAHVGAATAENVSSGSTGNKTVTYTLTSGSAGWAAGLVRIPKGDTSTIAQADVLFRKDDGSETTATNAASQGSNVTHPLGTNLRPRFLLQATGDPLSYPYTLRYELNGSGGYLPVPTSGTPQFPVVEGTAESSVNTAGTSHAVTLPAGIVDSDLVLITMDIGSTSATLNSLTDWSEILDESAANGLKVLRYTGSGVPSNPTFTSSASTRSASIAWRISNADKSVTPQIGTTATGTSTTPNPPSVSPSGGTLNYLFIAFYGAAGEEADDDTWSDTPPTNYTPSPPLQKACGTVGTNLGGMIAAASRQLNTGSAEDPGTFAKDTSAAWRAQTICIHPKPVPVFISASSNITSGGEATTQQMTGGTGSFTAGRMWDDENGSDNTDIGNNNNAEFEWCVQAQSPAVNTDIVRLRVYKGSVALNSYTTLTWTIGTPGGGSVTLTAATGSFGITGQAASLKFNRKLTAAQGSFTHTGQDASLKLNRRLAAAQAAFALAGQDASLKVARKLTAAQGSFAVNGQDASLKVARSLPAAQGSFAISGQNATLKHDRKLSVGQGSFAIAGQDASIKAARILSAGQGSFSLTGQDATLRIGRTLTASAGSYAINGQNAGLRVNRLLGASHGSFAINGQAATFNVGRTLLASVGTFTVNGQDATLRYARRLVAGEGSFSLAGQAAQLLFARRIAAAEGAYSLVGQAASIAFARRLAAAHGSYALTGIAATLTLSGATQGSPSYYRRFILARRG